MKPTSEITPREYLVYRFMSNGHIKEESEHAVNLLIEFYNNKGKFKQEEFDLPIGNPYPAFYLQFDEKIISLVCMINKFYFSTFWVVYDCYEIKYKKLTIQEAKSEGWVEETELDHLFLNELLGFNEEEKSTYSSNKSWSLSTPEVGSIILHRGTDSMDNEIIRKSKYFFGKIIEVLEN